MRLFIPIGVYELLNGIIEGSSMTLYKAFLKTGHNSIFTFLLNTLLFLTIYLYKKEDIKQEAKNFLKTKNKKKDGMILISLAILLAASIVAWNKKINLI